MSFESPAFNNIEQKQFVSNREFTDTNEKILVFLSVKIAEKNERINKLEARLSQTSLESLFRKGPLNDELDSERRALHSLEEQYRAIQKITEKVTHERPPLRH
jgi:predicted  nucleic acid-binding Zn-ribbon protein